jgi:uncharacterized protein (TIGR02996 family)
LTAWTPADANEATLMLGIQAGDDAAREVYADWLEERGELVRAELLRTQERLVATDPFARSYDATLRELRGLERRVDPAWRQLVMRTIDIPFWVEFPVARTRRAPPPRPAPIAPLPMFHHAPRPRRTSRRRRARAPRLVGPPVEVPAAIEARLLDPRPTPFRFVSSIAGSILLAAMLVYWLGVA